MKRDQVEKKYLWNVKDVFADDEAWERSFRALESPDFSSFRGTLKDAEHIKAYFEATEKYEIALLRVYLYAHMKHDEDIGNAEYASYMARVMSLVTRFGTMTAFGAPEISSLSKKRLKEIAADPRLKDYAYFFERLIAKKKHVLSEKEERILARAAEPLSVAGDAFEMLDNVELDTPEIEFEGKKVKLTHGVYSAIICSSDRQKRQEAFKKYYAAYRKIAGTLAVTYYGNVKTDIFYKDVRGFGSCLEMALFDEDVSPKVYRNLIESVNEATPLLHRYMRLRKEMMGFGELRMYDLNSSIVEDAELKLGYEEAFDLVIQGLSPLGKDYADLLKRGRDDCWVDVYETDGKKSGAYSVGVFGIHPFVLLNYSKTTQDVFTIAHEMGHAIHSYFSSSKQPYCSSEYKIFVAEVASTVNEVLLLKYLLKTTTDRKLKKYLVNYFLDMIRTTLFRQSQFAEFEERAHDMAERGEPLTKDNLSQTYFEINQKYYGDAITYDREIETEWARIPHFYHSFYVYKYATGITAAVAIVNKILSEGEPAVKKYFEFLSGGSSTDPVSLLKIAGADMSKKQPFESVMNEFKCALDELESMKDE